MAIIRNNSGIVTVFLVRAIKAVFISITHQVMFQAAT